jgi:hypothetical protein
MFPPVGGLLGRCTINGAHVLAMSCERLTAAVEDAHDVSALT